MILPPEQPIRRWFSIPGQTMLSIGSNCFMDKHPLKYNWRWWSIAICFCVFRKKANQAFSSYLFNCAKTQSRDILNWYTIEMYQLLIQQNVVMAVAKCSFIYPFISSGMNKMQTSSSILLSLACKCWESSNLPNPLLQITVSFWSSIYFLVELDMAFPVQDVFNMLPARLNAWSSHVFGVISTRTGSWFAVWNPAPSALLLKVRFQFTSKYCATMLDRNFYLWLVAQWCQRYIPSNQENPWKSLSLCLGLRGRSNSLSQLCSVFIQPDPTPGWSAALIDEGGTKTKDLSHCVTVGGWIC